MSNITLWLPEPDPIIHQALGKSCEEASELAKILARCLIQGVDGVDPGSGKTNRQALIEEIADTDAAIGWLRHLLDIEYDEVRADRKFNGFRRWEGMIMAHCDLERAGAEQPRPRDVGVGMAMAAGIIMKVWGDTVPAGEILNAAGFATVADLVAGGVDEYDINLVRPALKDPGDDEPDGEGEIDADPA